MKRDWVVRVLGGFVFSASTLLSGCGFFVDPTTTTTTPGTGTGATGDYAYVLNSNSTLSEFSIASSSLTAISGSPLTLGSPLSTASSVVVSPSDSFMYVGGDGGILAYAIGTDGSLTQVTAGGVTEIANYVSMCVSPNGEYLLALDNANNAVWIFAINTTTGVLTPAGSTLQLNVAAQTAPGRMIQIAPNGGLVAVAEGVGGDDVFTFNQTNGTLAAVTSVNAPGTVYTDLSVAFDTTSSYLFIGRGITATGTSSVLSYAVSATGVLGNLVGTYPSGQDPYSILPESTGTYVYSANRGSANLSGYKVASGVLTAVQGSPFLSAAGATSIGEDNSKKYVLAAAVGGATASTDKADLTLYSFDALVPGQLDPVATASNGSGVVGSIAVALTY